MSGKKTSIGSDWRLNQRHNGKSPLLGGRIARNRVRTPELPAGNRSVQDRVAQLACERVRNLPVWVRAPKFGHEFYSGCSRPKLYEWAAKGFIRSVSIREPGRIKGVRLFHLASILAFIERCEASARNYAVREPMCPPAALASRG